MDPHTHKQLITGGHNTSWGESSSFENMASMEDHSHSHVFFHDQQHHLPSLDHHSLWQSSSSHYNNNYIIPFSQSHHIISSPSLFFVGSSAANHHQPTLDHQYDHIPEKLEVGHGRDLAAGNEEEDEEGADEVDEELSAMKEMMYKIAAMQPVDIDPSTIRKPKRRNVRISDDPQSVAARHRRERISEKMRILQRLVPGGTKMDTASMLDEAIRYVKFLKRQIKHLQQENHPQLRLTSLKSCLNTCADDHHHLTNKQQQQCARNTLLLHHHDSQAEESLDLTSNKHDCMANNNSTVHIQEMDVFNQVIGGFTNMDHQR